MWNDVTDGKKTRATVAVWCLVSVWTDVVSIWKFLHGCGLLELIRVILLGTGTWFGLYLEWLDKIELKRSCDRQYVPRSTRWQSQANATLVQSPLASESWNSFEFLPLDDYSPFFCLMMYFHSRFVDPFLRCPPCQQLKPMIHRLAQLLAAEPQITIGVIDTDENDAWVEFMEVAGWKTIQMESRWNFA